MCQYQQLASHENGYIIRCIECRHYQVHFARMILTLSEQEFLQLYKELESMKARIFEEQVLVLKTPKKGVHLVLSDTDLVRFCEMAEIADNEIKAQHLLELFNSDAS